MNKKERLQVLELDKLNMSQFLTASGKVFDIELRKSCIKEELENGAVFLIVKEKNKVIGYVEYHEKENQKLTIKSIQIHPSKMNGFTLRKLIQIIYPKFKNSFEKHTIISAVHATNKPSIALHEKTWVLYH